MTPRHIVALIGLAALLAGAAPLPAGYPGDLPTVRLAIEPVDDGATRVITARVARTPAERRRGLQHVDAATVRANPLWFVFPQPRRTRWHMRNVRVPLDIVYVASGGRVVGVERMRPGRSGYGTDKPIRYALELIAGRAAELGLGPDSRIRALERIRPGGGTAPAGH